MGLPGPLGKPREVRLAPREQALLASLPGRDPCCCPHAPTWADARGLSLRLLHGRARSSVAKEAGGPSWGALGSQRQPAARAGGAAAFPGSSRGAGGPDLCHSWTPTLPLLRRGVPFRTIPPCPGPSPPHLPQTSGGGSLGPGLGRPAPPICGKQRLPWAPSGPSCSPSGAWARAAPRCPRRGSSRSPGAGRCTPRRACSHCPTCRSHTAYRGRAGCRGCGAGGGTDTANSSPS